MASIRQLLANGDAKRADLVKIWIEQIHVEPGFNAPESPEDFDARVESAVAFIIGGGRLPPIEVRDRAEGGVWIVEGHARHEAYKRAFARGMPLADPKDGRVYMLTIPFLGNDLDRNMRVITSARARQLSPLQIGVLMKRNRNLGQPVSDIAKAANLSAERVRQLLVLADSNSDVQKLVQSGEVPAHVAIDAQRKHKGAAGPILTKQLAEAKASGKKRLTTTALEGKKVKASELDIERQRLDFLIMNLAIVHHGDAGYWVEWGFKERQQSKFHLSPREAIDAAIAAQHALEQK